MTRTLGIAASGHALTSAAATRILQSGGNAFDAALGALCAACVSEPLLASLGGGGFLMARPAGQDCRVFDFFTHTPRRKLPEEALDFYPIQADFGTAAQEFHIGMGSIAVPGVVAGMFAVHRKLCRLPMREIVAPAIELAAAGVPLNAFQRDIACILQPILQSAPEVMQLFSNARPATDIAAVGEILKYPALADSLAALASEGEDLFYRGDWAQQLVRDCRQGGGMLGLDDLANYRVRERQPVRHRFRGAELLLNPPPSPSGLLVAFALAMLEGLPMESGQWGRPAHGLAVVRAMQAASQVRRAQAGALGGILAPAMLQQWRESSMASLLCSRGTTHLSVTDADGNLASLTVSNGEGSGYLLPGSGIFLNNMLGEEDLNPGGFHRWPENRRMASMMCPVLVLTDEGHQLALGSGGSNRIRSALLQVITNLAGLGMSLERAVQAPRLHLEGSHLSIEAGYPEATVAALCEAWPDHRLWPERNLFFGGTHAVECLPDGSFEGAGDPRRGGAVALATSD